MKKITVVLAEDHTIVREGLRELLRAAVDIEVIAEVGDGRQAVALARRLAPDVIVMDLAMPRLNGMEATRQIVHARPATKVLVLSAHRDDGYVKRLRELGASGYLTKQTAANVLAKAVRAVAAGQTCFGPARAGRLPRRAEPAPPGSPPSPRLTSRQTEILQLIAEGQANKQIAAELGISIKTVEKHRQGLMDALNVHETAGLTRYAIATGIIECPPSR